MIYGQLTFQNALSILIMHYSRVMPTDGQRYFTSTAVFLNEVLKLAISITMALYEIETATSSADTSTAAGLFGGLARVVFTGDSWRMAIPAMLYTMQNSLVYVAVSHLSAATFQVTYQLKILTTAVFSVLLLNKSLTIRKWLSLLFLMLGVAVVQIPAESKDLYVLSIKDLKNGAAFHSPRSIWDLKALGNAAAGQLSKRSATYEGIDEDFALLHPEVNATVGLTAVLAACLLSGLAGVYFEKILKDPKGDGHSVSVWVRNVQLSFYSLWPALFLGVFFKDGPEVAKNGFFAGYNYVVWTAICFQATGGVIVALVVKYSDNIAKNFATSISIVVSLLASVLLFDFKITSSVRLPLQIVFTWSLTDLSTSSARPSCLPRRISTPRHPIARNCALHPLESPTMRKVKGRTSIWSHLQPQQNHLYAARHYRRGVDQVHRPLRGGSSGQS